MLGLERRRESYYPPQYFCFLQQPLPIESR